METDPNKGTIFRRSLLLDVEIQNVNAFAFLECHSYLPHQPDMIWY